MTIENDYCDQVSLKTLQISILSSIFFNRCLNDPDNVIRYNTDVPSVMTLLTMHHLQLSDLRLQNLVDTSETLLFLLQTNVTLM